jgi:hypothetical protein
MTIHKSRVEATNNPPSPALRGRPSQREGIIITLPLGGSDAVAAGEAEFGRNSKNRTEECI